MAHIAADSARCSIDRLEFKAASFENRVVGLIHFFVGFLCLFFAYIERITVFHDELSASHQTETRADFVTEFALELVKIVRQLLVASEVSAHHVGDDFFVRRTKAEITAFSVFQAEKFRTVVAPSAAFLPKFSRLD